ncbi:hypothetical protein [Pedobacter sp. R-06]|uniref:hypothetical protein n=1 Tax=Pedobacter sp. R-06 TaxID=3404051 RepID=UPI003CF322C7
MKNKIYFLLISIMIFFSSVNAQQIKISSFSIEPNYLTNGAILIPDATKTTGFKYRFNLSRDLLSTGGFYNGACKVYIAYSKVSDFSSSTIPLQYVVVDSISLTNDSFKNAAGQADRETIYNTTIKTSFDSKVPAGLTGADFSSGSISLLLKFYDNVQNTTRISSTNIKYGLTLAPPPSPSSYITINSINKVETILFGTDCGFPHAYGTSYNPNGFMENGVWKFAYDISFTKNNASVVDSDIYWEWEVADMSNYPVTEKQFLVYPYGTIKGTPMNGNKKVFVEANDYLDEYDSKVFVRAKSRSTGSVLSSTFTLYFNGVNH